MLIRVIDFETTGFPPNAGIVQVGYTDVTLSSLGWTIGDTFQAFCNPKMPISYGAMGVHHITPPMIENAPPPEQLLSQLDGGVDYFCAHNAQFERGFYDGAGVPWICTMRGAQRFIPNAPDYKNQTLRYYLQLVLDPKRCEPAHAAGPDTYVTAGILCALLKGGATPELLVEVEEKPQLLETVPFGKHKGKPWAVVPTSYIEYMLASANPDRDVKHTMLHHLKQRGINR